MLYIRSICYDCVLCGYRPLFGLDTMTIIVAAARNGRVVMGGDRSSVGTETIQVSLTPKINRIGNWLIGYAGNGWGTPQLSAFATLPDSPDDLEATLRQTFVSSMRSLIEEYGGQKQSKADFLVGGYGRLFETNSSDWSFIELEESAIGQGYHLALGSLYTTSKWKDQSRRVEKALDAAIHYAPGCCYPIDIEEA